MNVLISGGTGFVGSVLAKQYVREGHSVKIISRGNKTPNNLKNFSNKITLIKKDIREVSPFDVEGSEVVFHLASTVDNYNIHTDPFLDLEINCRGTISLLEAVKNTNPSTRIIYASTFFVSGKLDSLPATSSSSCNPLGLYPATKLAAENFCKTYNEVFEMNSLVARLTNVFGPNEKGDSPKKAVLNYLIKQAVLGEEIKIYNQGNFFRDYLEVNDACSALRTLAEKGTRGETYYVGRGEKVFFKDLIDIIVKHVPHTKVLNVNPPRFHRRIGMENFYCDNTPLRNLGWKPRVSLEEGILNVIRAYKNE